jgi:fucose permease
MKTSIRNITYLCYFTLFLFAVSLTSISPLLPAISKTFSLNKAQAGAIFTTEFTGFMLFIIFGGFLGDRFGKRQILMISVFGFAVSLTAFSLAGTYPAILITMFFVGGFGSILESMSMAMVFDIHEHKRSFYVNLSQVFFGAGAITGPFFAGMILSYDVNWRVYYYVLIFPVIILGFLFVFFKMPNIQNTSVTSLIDIGRVLKNRKFLLICLCMFLYVGSEIGGWGWLSTLLKEDLGFPIVKAGLAVSVFWIAMTAGRILCGSLTLKYKLKTIVITLASLSSIATFLSAFITTELLIWIVIAAMGLSYSSLFSLIVDYGTQNSSISSGITVALLIGSGSVGSMTVPYIMGIVGQNYDLSTAMLVPSFLLIFIAAVFIRFKDQKTK